MVSSEQHTSEPIRKRTLMRRALLPLALVLCIAMLAGTAWMFNSERGAQLALTTIEAMSNGALQTRGIGGQLSGPLRIEQININLDNQKIILDDVQVDTQLSALLLGKLHVTSLQIGKLGIVSKIDQTKEPAKLPEKIGLPIRLQIDKVQVDGGDIAWGPVNVVTLGAFAFNLDFDGKRYLLNLDQFAARSGAGSAAFSGKFNGKATLSTAKPYPLQATLSSDSEAVFDNRNIGANGQIDLQGSLAEIAATIDLHVNQATIKGHALLRPFAEQVLSTADLSAHALDLANLAPDLPKTSLDIRLNAAENGDGNLIVDNAAAGLYDENRVPLSKLQIDFTQKENQFTFSRIIANLGSIQKPAGNLNGNGRYANGALDLALKTDALDLKKLDRRARATRLNGTVEIRHADGKQTFAVALSEPLKKNKLTLNAHAVIADEEATIDRAELRIGDSAIDASARFALNGKQPFDARGVMRNFRIRDLGDFPQLPALTINGDFSLRGARQPMLEADVSFRIRDSQLAGNPLVGDGQVQLRANTLFVPKLLLSAGANRISAQGKLAENDSRIAFTLDAPAMEHLGAGFAGAMQINGEVRGKVQQPRIVAEWTASRIRVPGNVRIAGTQGKVDVSLNRNSNAALIGNAAINAAAQDLQSGTQKLASLNVQGQFSMQPNAPVSIVVRADGISGTQLLADSFSANVSGTTAQHQLSATLIEPDQTWKLTAAGGLKDPARDLRWQGSVNTLDASGRVTAKLAAPAPLLVSQKQVQLDRFRLNANNTVIAIEQFVRNDRGVATRGTFERLQVSELLRYLKSAPAIGTDLTLGGEWDFRFGERLDGTFGVRRESGDVTIRSNASVTLGLTTLSVSANASNGRIALKVLAEGKQTGRIDVNLDTTLGSGSSRFSIAPNAPLKGSAHINTPTLGWLGPLLSPTLVTEGSLQSNVTLDGTFGKPHFTGQIAADGLRLLFTDLGVDLKQGTLRSEFKGDQLIINNLSFQNGGSLVISGPLSLVRERLALELSVKASRYMLIDRSDRKLVISGNSVVGWRDGSAKANGKFVADAGFIDIGAADTPTLSDDVVIVGQTDKPGKKTAVALDLDIGLGDGIRLRGRGINALLVGQLRLFASAGDALRAEGTLRVASGTFKAYGRELAIEQGLLRFGGPINNPALDILAMRRGQEVEAGVSVRGTVLAPRITLVSEPTVADAEKLSWLVLGRGLSGVGDSDISALQSAAGSLLTQGAAAGLQSQIATAFGLDDFSIGTDATNLQERIVTLGKKISSRLYVSYQQGLESASSVLLLRYTLTPRISVEAEAGTRSALSLFYNFAFD